MQVYRHVQEFWLRGVEPEKHIFGCVFCDQEIFAILVHFSQFASTQTVSLNKRVRVSSSLRTAGIDFFQLLRDMPAQVHEHWGEGFSG